MSLRILLLGLAVAVCALWPQGLVLCVGEGDHAGMEPDGAPCCPADHPEEDRDRHGDHDGHEDCADCRDYESPELATVSPAPAVPAPGGAASPAALLPDAAPATALTSDDLPPRSGPDDLRSVILVV